MMTRKFVASRLPKQICMANVRCTATTFLIGLCAVAVEPAHADFDVLVSSFHSGDVLWYDSQGGGLVGAFVSGLNGGPFDLTFGPDGDLYLTSWLYGAVDRYDGKTGAFIDRFLTAPTLGNVDEIEFGPDGNLYVSAASEDKILRYDGQTGTFIDVFASGDGLISLTGFTFGPDGDLYVADFDNNGILHYDGQTGSFVDVFASGIGLRPTNLAFGPDNNLYVATVGTTGDVVRFDGSSGDLIGAFVATAVIGDPVNLAFGPDGDLYVGALAGSIDDNVARFDGQTGDFVATVAWGSSLRGTAGIAFTPEPSSGLLVAVPVPVCLGWRRMVI